MYDSQSLFLFPNQLIIAKSEKFKLYGKSLTKLCYKSKEENSERRLRSNRLGWQSKKKDYHKEPEFKEFFDDFNEMFSHCLEHEFNVKDHVTYNIVGSFIQLSPPNAFNYSHIHPKEGLTCVFYVKIPENSGNIAFGCPDVHILNNLVGNRKKDFAYDKKLLTKFEVEAEEGMLLIFPSTLRHQVEPNLSNEDRISFGIDIKLISNTMQAYEVE